MSSIWAVCPASEPASKVRATILRSEGPLVMTTAGPEAVVAGGRAGVDVGGGGTGVVPEGGG